MYAIRSYYGPYSKPALQKNAVDIRCGHGSELITDLEHIANTWDDSFEMIMVVCYPDTVTPEALMEGTTVLNEKLKPLDLMTNFDHPATTHPRYRVVTTNGKYAFAIVQRLSAFVKAANPLFKKNYFNRITSYNVCYTKLLRGKPSTKEISPTMSPGPSIARGLFECLATTRSKPSTTK